MSVKNKYKDDDNVYDVVEKNKQNILELAAAFGLIDLTIKPEGFTDVQDFNLNGKLGQLAYTEGLNVLEHKLMLKTAQGIQIWLTENEMKDYINQQIQALEGGRFLEWLRDDNTFPDSAAVTQFWNTEFGSAPKTRDHVEVILNDESKFALYTFNGNTWIKGAERTTHIKGGTIDLSNYATKPELQAVKTELELEIQKLKDKDASKADKDLSNSTGIQFYKGQILEFNELKTGTKFEDATLFAKHIITEGYAIVGGTDGSTTQGQVKSDTLKLRVNNGGSYDGNIFASNRSNSAGIGFMNTEGGASGAQADLRNNRQGEPFITGGGSANLPAGIKLLKVVYVAKKDITFGEII